jgi:Tfp pilus assembly protein PilO
MKKIPENILIVIKSFIPLFVIIILFIILSQVGIGKINEVRSQISSARQEQGVLTQKLDILRTVSVNGAENANVVTNALPDSTPSLAAMSQLKRIAAENNLVLRAVKSGSSNESNPDFNSVSITFNLIGNKNDITSFVNAITTYAPISIVDSVKMSQSGTGFIGNVTIKSFWAPFPAKLPATIEQFNDLNADDKQVLSDLSGLAQPVYLALPPASSEGKTNPFED